MTANKPSPGRIVIYTHKDPMAAPWPAIVVEVYERTGKVLCDLQLFPTRGHGIVSLRQDVQFVDLPGLPDSCAFPTRVE